MIQNVVERIGGIGGYGVISICLFFAVFTGALLIALCHRKSFYNAVSRLPLEDGEKKGTTSHE
jgi:hypothetical protein